MKKIIIVCIAFLLIFAGAGYYLNTNRIIYNGTSYTVVRPYDYPVVPGTEEWRSLQDHEKMTAVCQIPEDILNEMSTLELADTVANYPLLVDITAYPDREMGYGLVREHFNGLQELESREDAAEVLQAYRESFDRNKLYVNNSEASRIVVEECLQVIAEYLSE
ncbi:MAG: hypothetical protein IJB73_05330 [Firmicutes bacterium]|nr:hypothetical protein [Bacillota bacterium]